ncbi:MAG: methylated-DNA--[protein]-cysteine S-methyltransferase [Caldilineaceae bacterium]|nr:methylated-DNA--[protein]-cysteine S-methyltransferase [Caldilineaceae bacterium]MCB9152081.1 methylated-DNA--[protein]-cysteine S-methyltransferase [Caldilineaceae bacterium]
MTYYTYFDSPLEPLLLISDGEALTGLFMVEQKYGPEVGADWVEAENAAPFPQAKAQLDAYFRGELTDFDLPLAPQGTDFQRTVWRELTHIPFGDTVSYGELAQRIDNPKAVRAVGLANGRNPISIIVPCHRVIGANGTLTGYGGGLHRKAALLTFESTVRTQGPVAFEQATATVQADAHAKLSPQLKLPLAG